MPQIKVSVVMPVFNEAPTIESSSGASSTCLRQRAHHRRRLLDRRHPRRPEAARVERLDTRPSSPAEPGQGRGAAHRLCRRDGRRRHHAGRRPGVRPGRVSAAAAADPRRAGRRRLRIALRRRRVASRAVLLALRGQQVADAAVQHVYEPEPHRHGDLLQGVPPRGHSVDRRSKRTASASSRRSRRKIAAICSCRIYEVGISYSGRTYEEGKKIGWRDGVRAVWCIFKYRPSRIARRRLATAASAPRTGGVAAIPSELVTASHSAVPGADRVR